MLIRLMTENTISLADSFPGIERNPHIDDRNTASIGWDLILSPSDIIGVQRMLIGSTIDVRHNDNLLACIHGGSTREFDILAELLLHHPDMLDQYVVPYASRMYIYKDDPHYDVFYVGDTCPQNVKDRMDRLQYVAIDTTDQRCLRAALRAMSNLELAHSRYIREFQNQPL